MYVLNYVLCVVAVDQFTMCYDLHIQSEMHISEPATWKKLFYIF